MNQSRNFKMETWQDVYNV